MDGQCERCDAVRPAEFPVRTLGDTLGLCGYCRDRRVKFIERIKAGAS